MFFAPCFFVNGQDGGGAGPMKDGEEKHIDGGDGGPAIGHKDGFQLG